MDVFLIEQRIDLGSVNYPIIYRQLLDQSNAYAHEWRVDVRKNGRAADLAGCTAQIYFGPENPEGGGIEPGKAQTQAASIDGHVARARLIPELYDIPGRVYAIMQISDAQDHVVTAAAMRLRTGSVLEGDIGDPTGSVIELGALLAQLDELRRCTAASNEATGAANAAARAANDAAENANTKASAAYIAAQAANDAAENANTKASAASVAAQSAQNAAANAHGKASNANAAANAANAAANRVDASITAASTAASAANAAANRVDTAIGEADKASNKANAAAEKADNKAADAEAAALRLSAVELNVSMLPPSENPTASATQTESKTIFSLGIPASNLAYATFEISDNMDLTMHSPDGFDDINFSLSDNGELEVEIK